MSQTIQTVPLKDKPAGYVQITDVSAAVGLTPPSAARKALIQAETQAVRWRDDGTDPTATVGITLAAGATLEYAGNLDSIKFFEAAASAKLNVSYYR